MPPLTTEEKERIEAEESLRMKTRLVFSLKAIVALIVGGAVLFGVGWFSLLSYESWKKNREEEEWWQSSRWPRVGEVAKMKHPTRSVVVAIDKTLIDSQYWGMIGTRMPDVKKAVDEGKALSVLDFNVDKEWRVTAVESLQSVYGEISGEREYQRLRIRLDTPAGPIEGWISSLWVRRVPKD